MRYTGLVALAIAGGVLGACTQSGYQNFDTTFEPTGDRIHLAAANIDMDARDGDVTSQRVLGNMYYWGTGVEQSDAKALRWWKRARDNGDAIAADNLARYHAGLPIEGELNGGVGREIVANVVAMFEGDEEDAE